MPDHLRYAGRPPEAQSDALRSIISRTPFLMDALRRARDLDLPDWRLVSGAIYNTVWNHLTGREPLTGIKDIDLFYFDASDLSYEAEDEIIQRGKLAFADLPRPVEIRNQARVHLWYADHFGMPYTPLRSTAEGIERFASRTHAVTVRLEPDDTLDIFAPYGLNDVFAFRITPNRQFPNRATHEAKGRRAMSVWPEVTLIPW